jgi:hypothetical protein
VQEIPPFGHAVKRVPASFPPLKREASGVVLELKRRILHKEQHVSHFKESGVQFLSGLMKF